MSPNGGENRAREFPDLARALWRGLLSFTVFLLVLAGSMYLAAGSLDWTRGWVFLGVYVLIGIVAVAYLWRTNPDVIVARTTIHWRDQTAGQNVIVVLLIALFVAIFPVAALDDARCQWSHMPPSLTMLGYVLFIGGTTGTIWVFRVNRFAEPASRIQAERSQKVIDTGPYAIVRHPMYASTFFLCLGMPLALGSYWALVPSAVAYLLLIVRTVMEDRMLHDELPGYKEYAARVRYRLLPGVW